MQSSDPQASPETSSLGHCSRSRLRWLGALALLTLGAAAPFLLTADVNRYGNGDWFMDFATVAWAYAAAWLSLRPARPAWEDLIVRGASLVLIMALAVPMMAGIALAKPVIWLAHVLFAVDLAIPMMEQGWQFLGSALVGGLGLCLLQHVVCRIPRGGWPPWLRAHLLGTLASALLFIGLGYLGREMRATWWPLVFLPHALATLRLAGADFPGLLTQAGLRGVLPLPLVVASIAFLRFT